MSKPLVIRRLYRSLLKASKPFTAPSPDATVMSCLLHRIGNDDNLPWEGSDSDDDDDNDDGYYDDEPIEPRRVLFGRLLRETVGGDDEFREIQWPSQVETQRLKQVIQREFRSDASQFDPATRQQVAFLALRELNKKLSWADILFKDSQVDADSRGLRNRRQAAHHVSPLPLSPASSYLQAGTYLVAHPLLTGYFQRSVVCILDHQEFNTPSNNKGTYGLIVNRIGVSPDNGKRLTMKEVLKAFRGKLSPAFGNCTVRVGGPVHVSLQMVYSRTPDQADPGGTVLSMVPSLENVSPAMNSDRAIYYRGDLIKAADAVLVGELDRDDVSFYVGASCWSRNQLESEIRRGFWLPCSGPLDMVLSGMCERVGDDDKQGQRPKADLWLSMICALGEDEANLAHLLDDDGISIQSEYGNPCDDF